MKEIWKDIWNKLKPVLIEIVTLGIHALVNYIKIKIATGSFKSKKATKNKKKDK